MDELPAMTSIEVRRLKRWLKRGPRLTRQGRAEFARWLLANELSWRMPIAQALQPQRDVESHA